jgi:sugar phosphate isomerase/epimerase
MLCDDRIDRRTALARLAGCTALATASRAVGAAEATEAGEPSRTGMGLVVYDCGIRRRWLQGREPQSDLFEPLTFLEHCRRLGAGGMQAALGDMEAGRVRAVREKAERDGMFIDAIIAPPRDEADLRRFEAEVRTAAEVGVRAARTVVMPGRRYEQFRSLDEFREAERRAVRMLERAAPVVERHRVRLAVENHKDQRIDERVALYERLGSEHIGACLDTGNSFALLDDPYGAVEALAPYAFTVHLKDQAVQEYEDGFLLGDIPLGQGCFDLKRMVEIIRRARPNVRMALELITRDPLKIPCLTDAYWATMPTVPGRNLARTLRIVREHSAENLQQVSSLSLAEQVELEDANIRRSLDYARQTLKL